ncbi:MAG: hypothetical protein VW270_10445 [Candidatus Poseidoniales archaeon]
MSEAFVYLWYDAPNKKYYLGKHKGTPDDSYTHSSSVWESFTKDTIPEGVSRRILAYGTDEEMCILENKLLVNRKKRCWDRYYNNGVGDPRYVDTSGENNHMYGRTGENHPTWKNGIHVGRSSPDKEVRRLAERRRRLTPKRKAYLKKYNQTPKRKAYIKEYNQKPEQRERRKEYRQKPKRKAYDREYRQRPEVKAYQKAYHKVYQKEYYLRKKAEKQAEKQAERQGVGTLEDFFG